MPRDKWDRVEQVWRRRHSPPLTASEKAQISQAELELYRSLAARGDWVGLKWYLDHLKDRVWDEGVNIARIEREGRRLLARWPFYDEAVPCLREPCG